MPLVMVLTGQSKIDHVIKAEDSKRVLHLVNICPSQRVEMVWLFSPSCSSPKPLWPTRTIGSVRPEHCELIEERHHERFTKDGDLLDGA